MTAGPVNRALLESNFQNPGDVYSDLKTEGAFDVVADQVDDNWVYLAGLVNSGTLVPYPAMMARQAMINGNFDIWQRGTSFTNPVSGAYTTDRFFANLSADGGVLPANVVNSRQIINAGDIPGSFYNYRIATDGAGSAFGPNAVYEILQRIENGTRFLCGQGRTVTVSFWAKSSVNGKKIGVKLTQNYGSSGAPTAQETINGASFSLTTSWARYSFTFTTNTLAGKSFGTDNNDQLSVHLSIMWGSNRAATYGDSVAEGFGGAVNVDVAQVQLSSSDVSLPFMARSIADELSLCQRYYEIFGGQANALRYAFNSGGAATYSIPFTFHVQKRIAPTVSKNGTWNVVNCGQPTPNFVTRNGFSLDVSATGAGLTAFNTDSTDDTITIDAEM